MIARRGQLDFVSRGLILAACGFAGLCKAASGEARFVSIPPFRLLPKTSRTRIGRNRTLVVEECVMPVPNWLRGVGALRKSLSSGRGRRPVTVRLELQQLEDRCVPSVAALNQAFTTAPNT